MHLAMGRQLGPLETLIETRQFHWSNRAPTARSTYREQEPGLSETTIACYSPSLKNLNRAPLLIACLSGGVAQLVEQRTHKPRLASPLHT